jgi:hypothetical protein
MRILVNLQDNDGWWIHCIAEDARTPISPFVSVASVQSLIRLLRYVGATEENIEEVREDIRRWNRGVSVPRRHDASVTARRSVTPTPGRVRLER